jgi:tetratricopeptide (TPR) repeat protein
LFYTLPHIEESPISVGVAVKLLYRRSARLSFWLLVVLIPTLAGAQESKDNQAKREPSTPEQRAKFIEFARDLETDPLGKDAQGMRAASVQWLTEVPDIRIEVCDLLPDLLRSKKNYGAELFGQTIISSGAFVAVYPDLTDDHLLVNTAGVVGALEAYQAILKVHPESKWPLLDDLLQKSTSGDLPAYVQDATRKCKQGLSPDDEGKADKVAAANDHLHKGNKFYDQERYQLALIEYRRAATLIPDQHNAYHELSQTFYQLKNYDKAIEFANRAIALDPKCWLCFQALGNIYDDSGKPEDALVQYNKAVDLAPNSGRPLYNSALTLNHLNRKSESISALEKAIQVDPQYPSPYRLLGLMLAEKNELYLARAQLEKFISLEPSGDRFDRVSQNLKPNIHLDGERLKQGDPQVDAYTQFGLTRVQWMTNEYKKRNPSADVYERTPDEELAALTSEAEKWQETKTKRPDAKDGELDRLLRIYQAGYLAAFVYANPGDHSDAAAQQWKQANPSAIPDFKNWATANSVAVGPLEQPVRVEWLGGDR